MADARFSEDFWTDPKIRKLDQDTQKLFIYLFTNPHRNYCGVYYLPKAFMREQTGISDRGIDWSIEALSIDGFIEYSDDYQMVFVKNMLKRQAPGYINAKQIKGIESPNRLHGCPLIKSFLETYSSLNITVSYTPIDTPMDVQSQSKSQSQSQSQSIKEDACPPTAVSGDAQIVFTCNHFEVSDGYFKEIVKNYPGFSEELLTLELKKMRDSLMITQTSTKERPRVISRVLRTSYGIGYLVQLSYQEGTMNIDKELIERELAVILEGCRRKIGEGLSTNTAHCWSRSK